MRTFYGNFTGHLLAAILAGIVLLGLTWWFGP